MARRYSKKRRNVVNVFDGLDGSSFMNTISNTSNSFSNGFEGFNMSNNNTGVGATKGGGLGGFNNSFMKGIGKSGAEQGNMSDIYKTVAQNTDWGDGKLGAWKDYAGQKSKETWNNSWSKGNVGGSVGTAISGAMQIGAATAANAKVDTSKITGKINDNINLLTSNSIDPTRQNYSGSNSDILGQVASQQLDYRSPIGSVSYKDFRPSKGKQWAGVGTATAAGAMAGAKIGGPWGALIGGAAGAISAGLGSLFGHRKAKKKEKEINAQIKDLNAANAEYNQMLENQNRQAIINAQMNNMKELANMQQANYHAFGGDLNNGTSGANNFALSNTMFDTQRLASMNKTKFTSMPQERLEREVHSNSFAQGGQFGTTPSYYPAKSSFGSPNQISEINNGGTHEQNPYEGVPMGVDSEGIPNLVEEGEVIWRGSGNRLIGKHIFADGGSVEQQEDYVFSNRLKPSQTLLNDVNIAIKQNSKKKSDKKSYADIAKELYRESKERPNDVITNNTINANLGKLKDAQEADKAKIEAKEARKNMANGMNGMMGSGYNAVENVNSGPRLQQPQYNQQTDQQSQYDAMNQQGLEQGQGVNPGEDLSMYNRSGNAMMGNTYAKGGRVLTKDGRVVNKKFNGDPIIPDDDPYKGMTEEQKLNALYRNYGIVRDGQSPVLTQNNVYGSIFGTNNDQKQYALSKSYGLDETSGTGNLSYPKSIYTSDFGRGNNTLLQSPSSNVSVAATNTNPTTTNTATPVVANNTTQQTTQATTTPTDGGDVSIIYKDGKPYYYNSKTGQTTEVGYGERTEQLVTRGEYAANDNNVGSSTNNNFPESEAVVLKDKENEKPPIAPGPVYGTQRAIFDPSPTWMRYAPVFGSALSFLSDLTGNNDPDYTFVNKLSADAHKGTYMPVSPTPIGDYLAYNPFDINYATNKLNAQSAATRRGVMNTSNGNRATALAGTLAGDFNAQMGLGNLQRQGYESNIDQRKNVGEFNKDTNKFNAENNLQAQMANQSALASLKQYNMQGDLETAKLKYEMDQANAQRKSANATSFFNNLGAVGQDNLNYNMAMSNPALYYGMEKNGNMTDGYKGNANGMYAQDGIGDYMSSKNNYKQYLKQQKQIDKDRQKALDYKKKMDEKTARTAKNGGVITRKNKKGHYLDNIALSL